jgi:hypothetical protein
MVEAFQTRTDASLWWTALLTTFDRNTTENVPKVRHWKYRAKEFVPPGQMVNVNSIATFWGDQDQNIRRKCPDKWRKSSWVLHHDNAPLERRSLCGSIRQSYPAVPNPRTSPLWLFPIPENEIVAQERRFDNINEIQPESQDLMKTLTLIYFQNCFRSWKSRWNRCINAEGDYFERYEGE